MKKSLKLLFFFVFPLLILIFNSCGGNNSSEFSTNEPDIASPNNTNIQTSEITLTWDKPTTNVDGTPLTDLAGFKVYFGYGSRNYRYNNDVGNTTICTVGGLTPGTWCFSVTAYDTSGNESDYSNEVCVDIN